MKTYKYYSLLLAMTFFTVSCKKNFLDVQDTSTLNRQSYVKDLTSMQEFLNGIYVNMSISSETGLVAAYPELVSDNMKPLPTVGQQYLLPHYTWSQQAQDITETSPVALTSLAMNGIWRSGYSVIRSCSFIIDEVDKYRNENPSKADNIKGQAYAIRAMIHFKLVNIFAQQYNFTSDASHVGIPYITTSDVSQPYSRQSVKDVYNAMISDLNDAIRLLPAIVTDVRYMNSLAAKALLARTYLFAENLSAAKASATEVSNQVPLMTTAAGYPANLFKFRTPSQTEVLFQLVPSNNPYTAIYMGRYLGGSQLRLLATNDIASILKENTNDVRNTWVTSVSGQWNITKFPTGVESTVTPAEISYYPAVVRSSEMFLIVAETSARLGDETTARTFVDAVRKRSNLTIAPITASGPALLDSIYKERRKELSFESLRMFDLQRWKLGVHRTDALAGAPKDLPYPSNKAVAPIPLQDIILAGISQNPGY